MESDGTVTGAAFVVLVAVLLGGTWASPTSTDTKAMVAGGQVLFLALTLALGVEHGEYRAAV